MNERSVENLPNEDLIRRLDDVVAQGNHLNAQLLVVLGALDARRVGFGAAYPSLFEYCVGRLGMSSSAACRRITAARVVRRFPTLLARLERGEIRISLILRLRDHLTEANVEELVDATRGRSKRDVAQILAARGPQSRATDAPPSLRKIPTSDASNKLATVPVRDVAPAPESRYRLQVTVDRTTRDKIERLRDFMIDKNPTRDIAFVVERALDALLEKLHAERREEPRVAEAESNVPIEIITEAAPPPATVPEAPRADHDAPSPEPTKRDEAPPRELRDARSPMPAKARPRHASRPRDEREPVAARQSLRTRTPRAVSAKT